MGPILIALLLSAAHPAASEASRRAKANQWDELYLAFAAAKPDGYSQAERRSVSTALAQGCRALEKKDAVMAYSLADRAVAFTPGAEALLCLVRSARRCDQRGAAEQALRQGLSLYPRDGRFGLELGRQLLEDHDPEGAQRALEKVPRRSPQAVETRTLTQRARREEATEKAALRQTRAIEVAIARGRPLPGEARHETPSTGGAVETLSYQSTVGADGMRTRANRHFVLKYFNDDRDFGQRADYEGHLVDAMERAHAFAKSVLGQAREKPCQVILYTRAEFTTHFGPSAARAIAGLYKEDAIRVNDAADLTPQTRATLVHEYVHAVVDEVAGFRARRIPVWMNEGLAEYVEWRYQGRDAPALPIGIELRTLALAHRIPKLTSLAQGPLIAGARPELLYAQSAVAIRMLLERKGSAALLELFAKVGGGAPFAPTFEAIYGHSLARFQEDLESELARK